MNNEIILHVKSLQLLYNRDLGLKSLDMTIAKGQKYGFLGRNGAGKSTSLQVLGGVLRPQAGTIRFKGETKDHITSKWKQSLGFVPQNPEFPNHASAMQLAKIISIFYPNWSDRRFHQAMNLFQLSSKRKVNEFSVGMKLMFSFVLAYAVNPDLYILDEPTAGLDIISRKILFDLLNEESLQGKTILLSTHIVDDAAENCDFLGIIDAGRTLIEGPIGDFGSNARTIEQKYLEIIKCDAVGLNP
ncbi:MAG: ABC transporter ATP-binding protein [Pseudobdellovibrionaceae bacterium]|nr:ABC transporter ATP-binding protein [Pseudobdellovibrionaceae bacterium]